MKNENAGKKIKQKEKRDNPCRGKKDLLKKGNISTD